MKIRTEDEKVFLRRWWFNHRLYISLLQCDEYDDLEFDVNSGGVKAIHKGHQFHDKGKVYFGRFKSSDLEKECQNILFNKGFACILENEKIFSTVTGRQLTSLDTNTDGMMMDIKSITENRNKTIENGVKAKRKQLHKFNEQWGLNCDSLILYFHNPEYFREEPVINGFQGSLKRIICVFGDGKINIYKKNNGQS